MAIQKPVSCVTRFARPRVYSADRCSGRAVCYKYTRQWQEMAADARQSCSLEPSKPENFLRCAVALKQLGKEKELQEVCAKAEALEMPANLRTQLEALMGKSK